MRIAKYKLGDVVKHRVFPFRGVVLHIDRCSTTARNGGCDPRGSAAAKDQPFYHLVRGKRGDRVRRLCLGAEFPFPMPPAGHPMRHPQVSEVFTKDDKGEYRPRNSVLNLGLSPHAAVSCRPGSASAARPAASSAVFEHLRIGRRPVIGLGEILQLELRAHRLADHVDGLAGEKLALFHAVEVSTGLVVGDAAAWRNDRRQAGHEWRRWRACPGRRSCGCRASARRRRAGHAHQFALIAVHFDDRDADHQQAGLDAAVFHGDADPLGVRIGILVAELHPRRKMSCGWFGLRRRRLR